MVDKYLLILHVQTNMLINLIVYDIKQNLTGTQYFNDSFIFDINIFNIYILYNYINKYM